MPDIHIQREHTLGLSAARELARQWADEAEKKYDLQCTYETCQPGGVDERLEDALRFTRSGVSGTLRVTEDRFVLNAKLGFLLGTFKDRIETEIGKNLDALLGAARA